VTKARKKKSANWGGKRQGAGPPTGTRSGGQPMDTGLFVRCSLEQREAIKAHVEELSTKRQSAGLPKINTTTWLRELALKHAGREDLGMAAQARREAESLDALL